MHGSCNACTANANAGIVMSKTFGVAKKATAIAVKIFGLDGSTTTLYVPECMHA